MASDVTPESNTAMTAVCGRHLSFFECANLDAILLRAILKNVRALCAKYGMSKLQYVLEWTYSWNSNNRPNWPKDTFLIA